MPKKLKKLPSKNQSQTAAATIKNRKGKANNVFSPTLTTPWKKRNTSQKSVPYEWMSEKGLCYLGNSTYSITYKFSDINYRNLSDVNHIAIFEQYCTFLNSCSETVSLQLHIVNKLMSNSSMTGLFLEAPANSSDDLKTCVKEYNDVIESRMTGEKSYIQDKYITIAIKADSENDAERTFSRIDSDCITEFRFLKSKVERLNEIERLYLLRNIYRLDDSTAISDDKVIKSGIYGKDLVAPYSIDTTRSNCVSFGDVIAKAFFVSNLPDELSDDFLTDICSVDEELFITINIKPQNSEMAITEVKKKLNLLDMEEYNSHQAQLKNKVIIPKTPRDLKRTLESMERFYDELKSKNEKMFLFNMLVVVRGKDITEISLKEAKISSKISGDGCTLNEFTFSHEDALNSSLPLGRNDTFIKRTMTTSALGAFSPFNVVEIIHRGGLCYGKNPMSNNLIIANRKLRENRNGIVTGGPGSGKSMGAKMEIWEAFLRTNDHILIIDLEDEFTKLVNLLGGQVIEISPGSDVCINPFDINEFYGGEDEPNPIPFKSDFILSLIDSALNFRDGIDDATLSIMDSVVRTIYMPFKESKSQADVPTFNDFFKELGKHTETEAIQLYKSLQIYVEGSLNVFAGRTNVPLDNRLVCFNIKKLGKKLNKMGMLVIQDYVWNITTQNQKRDGFTWFYNDEVHHSLKVELTSDWLIENWKRGRKYGLIPTGMTQEMRDVLRRDETRSLIANSEFLLLYRQTEEMLPSLSEVLNLSPHQISKLISAENGTGLMKIGSDYIEFDNRIPKDTNLYEILKTSIGQNQVN